MKCSDPKDFGIQWDVGPQGSRKGFLNYLFIYFIKQQNQMQKVFHHRTMYTCHQ